MTRRLEDKKRVSVDSQIIQESKKLKKRTLISMNKNTSKLKKNWRYLFYSLFFRNVNVSSFYFYKLNVFFLPTML